MCKMFMVLKMCSKEMKGEICPFAHSYRELTVEYKPNEWVKFFNQKSQRNLKGTTMLSTQNEFRKTTDPNNFRVFSSGKLMTAQDSGSENINKIINTVFPIFNQ